MFKVFLKFPDALRPAFPRLKEKLEDPDPGLYEDLDPGTNWVWRTLTRY